MAQEYTEHEVYRHLSLHLFEKFRAVMPRYKWGAYESDALCLDQVGMWTDHEIKCTRADYFADFKKGTEGYEERVAANDLAAKRYGEQFRMEIQPAKHEHYAHPEKYSRWCPNYLVFVCPEGMIDLKNVPKYAGLTVFTPEWEFKVVRRRVNIHKREMPQNLMKQMLIASTYRLQSKSMECQDLLAKLNKGQPK